LSNSSNYVQILIDFLRNKDIDVKKEKRNWIRFAKSNTLVYVNASKEYPGSPNRNHGWYDFSKRTYDELVSDKTTYDSYCAILLGTPEMVFVLSKDDIRKIFDEQFMNKPDEWMFHVLEENGEFVLKFTKKDTPTHMMGKFLNQWNQITNSKAQSERTRTQDISTRQQETNETDSLCNALWAEIKPTHHLSSLDKTTIERWTKALGPLRAKITSESYEAWKTKLDVETLSEIYDL
jgi:hypothetical protein